MHTASSRMRVGGSNSSHLLLEKSHFLVRGRYLSHQFWGSRARLGSSISCKPTLQMYIPQPLSQEAEKILSLVLGQMSQWGAQLCLPHTSPGSGTTKRSGAVQHCHLLEPDSITFPSSHSTKDEKTLSRQPEKKFSNLST